jgi:hypothetical protein
LGGTHKTKNAHSTDNNTYFNIGFGNPILPVEKYIFTVKHVKHSIAVKLYSKFLDKP